MASTTNTYTFTDPFDNIELKALVISYLENRGYCTEITDTGSALELTYDDADDPITDIGNLLSLADDADVMTRLTGVDSGANTLIVGLLDEHPEPIDVLLKREARVIMLRAEIAAM